MAYRGALRFLAQLQGRDLALSSDGYSLLHGDIEATADVFQAQHDDVQTGLRRFEPIADAVHAGAFGRTIESGKFWSSYNDFHRGTVSSVNSFCAALQETAKLLQKAAGHYDRTESVNAADIASSAAA